MEKSKIVEWELHGEFGVLTINNPPQNYLDELEFVALADLKRWTSSDSLRGIIVTGKGRHFCAGANQENLLKIQDEQQIYGEVSKCKAILQYLHDLPIPMIAAINGVCFGGGLEVALACHARFCSEKSLFSFPEASVGIIPLSAAVMLVKKIGMKNMCNLLEIMLAGKMMDAEEALRLKIVDSIVPGKEVLPYSLDFLQKINTRPLKVLRSVMKSFNTSIEVSPEIATEEETRLVAKLVLDAIKVRQKIDVVQ